MIPTYRKAFLAALMLMKARLAKTLRNIIRYLVDELPHYVPEYPLYGLLGGIVIACILLVARLLWLLFEWLGRLAFSTG